MLFHVILAIQTISYMKSGLDTGLSRSDFIATFSIDHVSETPEALPIFTQKIFLNPLGEE